MTRINGVKYSSNELAALYLVESSRNKPSQDPRDMMALVRIVKQHVKTLRGIRFKTLDEYVACITTYLAGLFNGPWRYEIDEGSSWKKDISIISTPKVRCPEFEMPQAPSTSRTEYKQLAQYLKSQTPQPKKGGKPKVVEKSTFAAAKTVKVPTLIYKNIKQKGKKAK